MNSKLSRGAERLSLAGMMAAALLLSACGNPPGAAPPAAVRPAPSTAALTPIVQDEAAFEATRMQDAGITARIDTQLQHDGRLNPQAIDVDTSKGRVVLRGLAPDRGSRERATLLAKRVEGVRSVENLLHVRDEEPPAERRS